MPTTSLGHLATLPVLVESTDAVLLDHQVHASVQMAANQLRVKGATVELIRHNNMERLEAMIERLASEALAHLVHGRRRLQHVRRPRAVRASCARCWTAIRSCSSTSTTRTASAGRASMAAARRSTRSAGHPRVIAACSLNKSFAAAGGAIVFPDPELRRRVRTAGGPMIFSGPIQPPLLGAAIASAKIHLSDELPRLQAGLRERIELLHRPRRRVLPPAGGA